MDTVTRRQFLKASGVGSGLALAAAAGVVTWPELLRRAAQDPLPADARILVVVTLYGGNDGLGTVVPYADPAYQQARPALAYTAGEVLPLDSELGLNPAMTGLHRAWSNRQLAIVRGVGYPKPDHSHFASMDIWQTASPTNPASSGWLGRWLDASGRDPLLAVSIGSVLPPLAVGEYTTAAALSLGRTRALPADLTQAMLTLAAPELGDTPEEASVSSSYRSERAVASAFGPVRAAPADRAPADAADSALARQLRLVGTCVKAGVPTRAYAVSLGGFDTHADEKGTQSQLLGQLDTAISTFLRDMAADARGRGVVLMVYSEFGRRVAANASAGTDHGTANPVLVAGVPVRGGFYGDQPSLTDLDHGDLKVTTDFRAIYAELIEGVLHGDPQQILGTSNTPVGFLV